MEQSKSFFEVFTEIKLDKEIEELLQNAVITKISATEKGDAVKIYINNDRILFYKTICKLKNSIATFLDKKRNIRVVIEERYNLTSQYNPKTLYDMYKASILDELKENSVIQYNILRLADASFDNENAMIINAENNVLSSMYTNNLKSTLEYIFNVRCGLDVQIMIKCEKEAVNKYDDMNAQMTRNEANLIAKLNRDNNDTKEVKEQNDNKEENKEKEDTGKEENNTKENKAIQKATDKKDSTIKKDNFFQKKENRFASSQFMMKKSDNPNVIYGKDFDDEVISLDKIVYEMGEVCIQGKIMKIENREIRNEKTIIMFAVTDFTDSIMVKLFTRNEQLEELTNELQVGKFVKIKGIAAVDKYDREVAITSVTGIMKSSDNREVRNDNSIEKRVELHCHTKMSDMDGVSDPGDIVKRAIEWGMKSIAITDHGCVQGFTDAFHTIQKIKDKYKKEDKKLDFKIIYGLEAYLVDDLQEAIVNSKNQSINDTYVVFDIETTGLSPIANKIIEFGAVKVENGKVIDRFSEFVNPQVPIPFKIEKLTGINDSMVSSADTIETVLPKFIDFCKDCPVVAHNAQFDTGFVIENATRLGLEFNNTIVDTVALARFLLPTLGRYKLDTIAKNLKISLENHHRAVDDANCTALIFIKFIEMLNKDGLTTLDAINEKLKASPEVIRKMKSHHAIILAASEIGRINLYRLVSHSHIDYFNKQPKIPKSDYLKNKEGLIIGSACEAGELYQAVLSQQSEQTIARLVDFYDYLEIQPNGNNAFMIKTDEEKLDSKREFLVDSIEDLENINRKIVKLGEKFNKPVVATCDVHFLNPEDEIYRRIIMAGKGFEDADNQAPLFLRTTQEMLDEFAYLGSDKAYEVVVTNTNKIADMIEYIEPVHPDKFAPKIPDSDITLRNICYNKAHEMYGENLPEIVTKRLERELNSIISNGFAVMYIIAQKLVWKSNEDGYLVGSRGSVGSSFVATMAGITEVNPLSPHYYCKKCHYSDFDSEEVLKYSGRSGCDMPDKACPVCGENLTKDGFDIPFETFLGFKGNKEPDIDLNFSGDYQSKAHEYTEVIFGKGQTFRAGTIGSLAEKTAYGYVLKYYEERNTSKRRCEIERIASGCVGVRRTTGQHPGGIIVLPHGEEIYKFTPVQRPANDMTTNTVTTHFDYHSIDHNLLKLDILGHDDPTMIKMLEELTGIDAKKIPLDDKNVMSLFESTKALGIEPEDIDGCQLGSLGIPEFGTDFVIQMLIDTKPQSFSDLIRISGLSHGTDVWLGNAQTLILEGKATISTAICTRDDIMIYLISKGVESELSFTIMESVRKGRGLKPEWIETMKEHDVPEWYIWSCLRIQYMFPKAHAAAYVMMAFRIAYCKVYYPLAYYCAFFSIRATSFDYELMCQGREKLDRAIKEIKRLIDNNEAKPKDEATLKDMKIVQEMYARGFEFLPIDIYKSEAKKFKIIDNKLLPALNTIAGLGDNAAVGIYEASKNGKYLSKDDFIQRTKVSKTSADVMADLNLLGDIPESNQISLFDFAN